MVKPHLVSYHFNNNKYISLGMNLSKITFSFFVLISLIVVVYAITYNWHDYNTLVANFSGDSPTFYHESTWSSDFFTPTTKAFGNVFSTLLALSMTITSVYWGLTTKSNESRSINLNFSIDQLFIVVISMAICAFFTYNIPYAYDEVFSAFHFAEVSPWIAWSHYPLPNNHVLFNVINALVVKILGVEAIMSGRLLSAFFYVIASVAIYSLTSFITENRLGRILITCLSIISLPILGFATQARGYSLMTLTAISATYSILKGLDKYFALYSISMVVGMCVMPSYLYFWLGFSLAILWIHGSEKQLVFKWLKHSWLTLLMILAFYLPVLSFSGLNALIDNKYVKIHNGPTLEFIKNLPAYWQGLSQEWFFTNAYGVVGVLIVCFTMLYLYFLDHELRKLSKVLISLTLATLFIMISMQKIPFYRNLAPFTPLFWLGISAVLFSFLGKFKKQGILIFLPLSIALLGLKIFNFNKAFPNNLYYYDVVGTYQQQFECIKTQNLDQCIIIDDDAFFLSSLINNTSRNVPNESKDGCIIILPDEKVVNTADTTNIAYQCGGYSWIRK